jgi:hypothetical protein
MTSRKPSGPVLGAAVVAIVGSLLTVFFLGLALLSLALVSPGQGNPEIPASFKPLGATILALFLCIAIFGIFTGINLIRLKNWARLSALVWAGIAVVFGALSLVFLIVIPLPDNAGSPPLNMHYVKAAVAVLYGIPVLVGIWWLLLFNQKSVKAQFTGTILAAEQPMPIKPRCPLPIALFAGFLLLSVAGMFAMPLMHMPVFTIIFGHRLRGEFGAFVFASMAVLYLAAAIGLLTLKRWSYPLIIGLSTFWLLSSGVTFLSPGYVANMQEMFAEMHMPDSSVASAQLFQNKTFALLALLPGAFILGLLAYYRVRFLNACAAAESAN